MKTMTTTTQQRVKKSNGCVKDKLSDLPDDLLHHILSFLDAKIAIQTSILSKRWRYPWTSIPSLSFKASSFCSSQTFENFVSQVLKHRLASPNFHSLTFDDDFFINEWADAETIIDHLLPLRALRNLTMNSVYEYCHVSNLTQLFSCQSLTALELAGLCTPTMELNSATLTKLHLDGCVFFPRGDKKLDLFRCRANLESLDLSYCTFRDDELEKFEIHAPRLTSLKLTWLSFFSSSCVTVLSTPKLTSFSYVLSSCCKLSIDVDLSFIEKVNIDIWGYPNFYHWFIELFGRLGKAKFVRLSSRTIEALCEGAHVLEDRPSPFTSLQKFEAVIDGRPCSFCLPKTVMAYLCGGSS